MSGTALSFELGLLWPRFMAFAGPLIGPAFALEGYAFFIEAIFLGLYLYGWERLTPRIHWLCGCAVAVSGALSGIFVLSTNAWMQDPIYQSAAPRSTLAFTAGTLPFGLALLLPALWFLFSVFKGRNPQVDLPPEGGSHKFKM